MASGKETTRQKMIGMMYLVLTAILALNVSKEILNAFVVVNESLGKTSTTLEAKNAKLYGEFDLAKSVDPVRVTPNWEKAQQVKKQSLELYKYLSDMKKELMVKTDGLQAAVGDTLQLAFIQNKEDNNTTTNLMIGQSEDGSAGYSRALKNRIRGFKSFLATLIAPADKNKINLGLETEDPKNSAGNENWELYNFYDTPLAAAVTILSKIQTDVKNAESLTVDYLLKQFDSEIIKFDTIAPKVIAQSNYVLLGEEYKADVFLAAFSKTQHPLILANESKDTLPVTRGMGFYSNKTSREGIFKWGGSISMQTSSGKTVNYPYESEYIVAKPSINVSAEKMKVFYTGVDNPVTIAAPGVANEKIFASIDNGVLTKQANGTYLARVISGAKATITVRAQLESGETRVMGTSEFRIKQLPTPTTVIDDYQQSSSISKAKLQSLYFLKAQYEPGFPFELHSPVIEFTISIFNSSGSSDKPFSGYKIAENIEVAKFLKNVKPGDKVQFTHVKAKDPSGNVKPMNDITFKVL